MNAAKKNKGATLMFNCIYGKRGFCTIKKSMTCENDCSYYCEPERDDGRLTIANEVDPMKLVFDNALLSVAEGITSCDDKKEEIDENEARRKRIDEDFKMIDKIFVKAVDENQKAIKEINETFQTFINDLRKKYLIEGDEKNDGQK